MSRTHPFRTLILNVTPRPPRGRACYPWQLSRIFRLAPHTNTSLFCALCPHSCAPGNNFPVGHASSNCSRPSTLNPEFFLDELQEKKVYLIDMSILSILLSPEPGCHSWLVCCCGEGFSGRNPSASAPMTATPEGVVTLLRASLWLRSPQ
jgi:hypothetical protein